MLRIRGRVSVRLPIAFAVFVAMLFCATASMAQWVGFADETSSRMVSDPAIGVDDNQEKDYAWGDIDQDGDIDLVVVRKQPFTSPGKRTNVLFMNENGVLTDRTATFAASSDVPGDNGFLTATNDRDVILVDLDDDTWLDMVTAVTISDGDPKHIGHPRVYMNLGEDGGGNWLGFRHEDARIPTMLSFSGQSGFNPRFCSVAAGDLTGDGTPELWFGDYDSSGAGGFGQPNGADYNDRLLVNSGQGGFTDATTARFSGVVPTIGSVFHVSAFGAAAAIADMNSDGVLDIIKQTSLNSPLFVGIAFNDLGNPGFFDTYQVVNNQSPYFVSTGDLNNDNRLDLVITDDGADRYMINLGNNGQGIPDWDSSTFSFDEASDDGFGSNNIIVDLNNDGWRDVLIADVDVDIGGCSRRLHAYRNLGGLTGGDVVLQEQTEGSGCNTSAGNPASCRIMDIPTNMLEGVHDMAIFDIDGDGWQDMVLGRCNGTEVYMNQPPTGLSFTYPEGIPAFIMPNQPFTFQVRVAEQGVAEPVAGSERMLASINGGGFQEIFLTDLGNGLFEATLPALANCTDQIEFYVTSKAVGGLQFNDPPTAPADLYRAIAALGTNVSFEDSFEDDVSSWTVVNDPSLTAGGWERAAPMGTLSGAGEPAAPDEDAEAPTELLMAFVTQNGSVGEPAGTADVDGGPTDLISPIIDLSGTDATINYSRWFFSDDDDQMTVWVTGDGGTWELVESVDGDSNAWTVASFTVSDHVAPSSTVQVRFRVSDSPNDSVTEGGVDLFRVDRFECATCSVPADCDDGDFCNGAETCSGGVCQRGPRSCPGSSCDEVADVCIECVEDSQCDDGNYCNGVETCAGDTCVAGTAPCGAGLCDDAIDACVTCLVDADCDDGSFCNGAETCLGGTCESSDLPCDGATCDDGADVCVGAVQLQPRAGDPLPGLSAALLDRFEQGKTLFDTALTVAEGLGPIFNLDSCAQCHNTPLGGSGSITVTRFGFSDDKGVGFDPLTSLGGSLRQVEAISPECEEEFPAEANVFAQRVTPSTLGFGLVEALRDSDIESRALTPPAGVSGRARTVPVLENPGEFRIGRFGWKSQLSTVLSFSADASLNEMGITNRVLMTEQAPNGDAALLALCDSVADPEDGPDGEGFHFIDRVTDFQRLLAPPPQTPRYGMTGEQFFNNVGCNSCHVASFTTSTDVALEDVLRGKEIKPYSDFLIHDMGENADFIGDGTASPRELRTAPLWGVALRDPLWHDGRVAGGTFEERMFESIAQHNALGSEGQHSALAFNGLDPADKDQLVAFLASLGRVEFDEDGNGIVNDTDFGGFTACFTGPGSFYNSDDPCAIHDVDLDGDVDDDDRDLFNLAADGVAGSVPDGFQTPGSEMTVSKAAGDQVFLNWGASCLADDDYEVYEGAIGDFSSHTSVLCSTGGATSAIFSPAAGGSYYLVVPSNGFKEGGYGVDSSGVPRPVGTGACLPQANGACQ